MTIRYVFDDVSVRHTEKIPTLLGRNLTGKTWKISEIILREVRANQEIKQGDAGLCDWRDRTKTPEHQIKAPWAEVNDKKRMICEAVGVGGGRVCAWLGGACCNRSTVAQTCWNNSARSWSRWSSRTLLPEYPWDIGKKTSMCLHVCIPLWNSQSKNT